MRVRRDGAKTCMEGMSAARTRNGSPVWRLHRKVCLDGKVVRMGLESRAGDVLFAGTRRNGAYVRAEGLTTRNSGSNRYRLIDQTVG